VIWKSLPRSPAYPLAKADGGRRPVSFGVLDSFVGICFTYGGFRQKHDGLHGSDVGRERQHFGLAIWCKVRQSRSPSIQAHPSTGRTFGCQILSLRLVASLIGQLEVFGCPTAQLVRARCCWYASAVRRAIAALRL